MESGKSSQDYDDEIEREEAERRRLFPEAKWPRAKKAKPPKGPTAVEEMFIAHYVRLGLDQHGAQAAILCGIKPSNARKTASRFLARPRVQTALKKIQQDLYERSLFSAENTLKMLQRTIMFDPRTMFDSDGNLRPVPTLKDDEAFALAGVDVAIRNLAAGDGVQDRVFKIKWSDRLTAIALAMRHFGLITPQVDVNINIGVSERLNQARSRMNQKTAIEAAVSVIDVKPES